MKCDEAAVFEAGDPHHIDRRPAKFWARGSRYVGPKIYSCKIHALVNSACFDGNLRIAVGGWKPVEGPASPEALVGHLEEEW